MGRGSLPKIDESFEQPGTGLNRGHHHRNGSTAVAKCSSRCGAFIGSCLDNRMRRQRPLLPAASLTSRVLASGLVHGPLMPRHRELARLLARCAVEIQESGYGGAQPECSWVFNGKARRIRYAAGRLVFLRFHFVGTRGSHPRDRHAIRGAICSLHLDAQLILTLLQCHRC